MPRPERTIHLADVEKLDFLMDLRRLMKKHRAKLEIVGDDVVITSRNWNLNVTEMGGAK